MMNKFRKRLILMTTFFVLLIMITAFTAIFISTYLKQKTDNYEKLRQSEEIHISDGKVSFDGKNEQTVEINRIVTGAGVYFNMLVDKSGRPIMIDSALKLNKKQYEKAAKYAWKEKEGGSVKINGREWQYVVAPAIANLDYDNKDRNINNDDETYLMRFLDVTDSKKSLFTLAMTLLIVGILLMIFFFFVIIYYTNRAILPMEEAWNKQKQFIADASHELKTPLSIISSNLGVLYSSKEDTINNQIKWLDNISTGTERMNGLLNKMLKSAKTESIFEPINLTKVQIDKLLRDSIQNYQREFEAKNISINCNLSKLTSKTDEKLLQQFFDIFIENALKYTNNGGCFEASLEKKGRNIVITFCNTGDGIAEDDIPKIFNRFYRTNDVRKKHEGSYGLGLSIAQNIVQQFKGKIVTESKVNDKTKFTIYIPHKRD